MKSSIYLNRRVFVMGTQMNLFISWNKYSKNLTLEVLSKIVVGKIIFSFIIFQSKSNSCESCARKMVNMKCQVFFSLEKKKNK